MHQNGNAFYVSLSTSDTKQ